MKIIHTGDWHIGKIVNEFSMIEDQEFILEQLIEIIENEKPQALIISGDLYDRSIPPVEAVKLLNKTFTRILLDLKIPILAIAGNHDSAERLSFGNSLLNKSGLHIVGTFNGEIEKVTLNDEHGPVNFYLIPYVDPKVVKLMFEDETIKSHDDAMKKILANIKEKMNTSERNVIVAHGYITYMKDEDTENEEINKEEAAEVEDGDYSDVRAGLKLSESERPLSIGGTDLINGEHFEDFNYTALGHLHRPQKVGSDKIRYAGSLLKYSTSESKQRKGATIVDLDENGEVTIDIVDFTPKRDIRIIKGPLNELISPEVYKGTNVEDYVYAILTDEGELVDPISKLRAVYPNIMGLKKVDLNNSQDSKTSASLGYRNKTKLNLFEEFFESIEGKDPNEDMINIISKVIEDVEKEVN